MIRARPAKIHQRAEILVTTEEIPCACQGELPPIAEEGIRLFDAREYWHAHEALEKAWLEEPGPVRHLYRGILQIAVMYLHVQRANFIGAAKMYTRSQKWLAPWPDHCRTVDVGQLRADVEAVLAAAGKLGPEDLHRFDQTLLKPIRRVAAT